MNTIDNTPTVLSPNKALQMSSTQGDVNTKCKFCGGDDGLIFVAIIGKGETVEDVPNGRFLWLCEGHYTALLKSREYEIRELPPRIELGHDSREEAENDDGVTIFEEENENRWLKISKEHETDLRDEV